MKIVIIIFYFLFLSNLANAQSIRDFEGDEKIKLNESYKCVKTTDKKAKFKFGFHEIEGTTFVFFLKTGCPICAILKFFDILIFIT